MATQRSAAVAICGRCQEAGGESGLVCLAVRGELVSVCSRCFLLEQVGDLTCALPPTDATRSLVEEGLRTLYDVVLARSQEIALAQSHAASSDR